MEVRIVGVQQGAQLRRQFGFRAEVVNEDAGIDEVRLAFGLAAAQARQQAARRRQQDRCVGQRDALRVEEADATAGELLMIENRIEAARGAVKRLLVARRKEERAFESEPVAI